MGAMLTFAIQCGRSSHMSLQMRFGSEPSTLALKVHWNLYTTGSPYIDLFFSVLLLLLLLLLLPVCCARPLILIQLEVINWHRILLNRWGLFFSFFLSRFPFPMEISGAVLMHFSELTSFRFFFLLSSSSSSFLPPFILPLVICMSVRRWCYFWLIMRVDSRKCFDF